jgi:hypothetical protein
MNRWRILKAYALCCTAQYRSGRWKSPSRRPEKKLSFRLALARFVAAIGLVDDVNAALAPDNLVVAVTGT